MHSPNCWEITRCGREPGGEHAASPGVCPAAAARWAHGLNGGKNGGRACWAIAGSFSRGEICGTLAARMCDCMACDFFARVGKEQGAGYMGAKSILAARNDGASRRRQPPARRTHSAASGTARGRPRTRGTAIRPPE